VRLASPFSRRVASGAVAVRAVRSAKASLLGSSGRATLLASAPARGSRAAAVVRCAVADAKEETFTYQAEARGRA